MSKSNRTVWACDAPRCKTIVVEQDEGDLPTGFHGTVTEIAGWGCGSAGTDWYACCVSHIAAAIRGVLDKDQEVPA
jgi:hypothetical protein